MKNIISLTVGMLCCVSISFSQIVEERRLAANALWEIYGPDAENPSQMPDPVPQVVGSLIDQVTIAPNYNALETALNELIDNNGGVLRFNNTDPVTISFNSVMELAPNFDQNDKERTIVIQGENITFNGQNSNSLFLIRGGIELIIQDATLKNANFNGISQDHLDDIFRVGGGAIEVAQFGPYPASLRVRNCQFIDNTVSHFQGIGENQNGAAIRLNFKTTGQVLGCSFVNNSAVTGGAIGGTSITKLTVINSVFDGNISNGYTSTKGYMDVVEGAGAIRVDRTIEPLEIYGSHFTNNAANVKVSVMEVFIRPVQGVTPGYPADGPALIIDNCIFNENKYHDYEGVTDFERAFFAGCIVFHSGGVDANFGGGIMKLSNSVFYDNEVGQANIRMINNFEFSDCIFANTQYLDVIESPQQGAVFLQKVHESGSFSNCTFYKNEPRDGARASDIMFWADDIPSKVQLNNSIFYRDNTDTNIAQVRIPLTGGGNSQYIPNVNMSSFPPVATGNSHITNPNIEPGNIINMCLGDNTLPPNIGGLPSCDSLGIGNYTNEDFTIFPNPTESTINIVTPNAHIQSIRIIDIQGKAIAVYATDNIQNYELDMSSMEAGMYFIQISTSNSLRTKKVIKK